MNANSQGILCQSVHGVYNQTKSVIALKLISNSFQGTTVADFITEHRLLDSLVVQCWFRVREVPGSIPSHTKDVIKMVPVVPLFSTEHSNGKILALSQEFRQENKCNGYNLGQKILRNRRSLTVVAGIKKTNDHAEPTKVER